MANGAAYVLSMRTPPHASLAVAVAAIRELIEQTRASHPLDAQTAQALDFALDGLGLMWEALEGEQQSYEEYERDCVDFFEFVPLACVLTDLNGMVRRANRPEGQAGRPVLDSEIAVPQGTIGIELR